MDKVKIMKELIKDFINDIRSDTYLRVVILIFLSFLATCFFSVFVLSPMFHSWPNALFRGDESQVIIRNLSISGFNNCDCGIEANIVEFINNVKNGGVRQSTLP